MPVRIKISVLGKVQFDRAFNRVSDTFTDFTPIWDDVNDEFETIEGDNFQSENVKGASGRWQKLSASYEKAKLAKLGSFALIAGVLRASDDLYQSMTRLTDNSVYKTGKQSFERGTSLKYAEYHQAGVPSRNLPARPVIDFSDDQKKKLMKRIQKALLPYVKKAGFVMNENNYRDF